MRQVSRRGGMAPGRLRLRPRPAPEGLQPPMLTVTKLCLQMVRSCNKRTNSRICRQCGQTGLQIANPLWPRLARARHGPCRRDASASLARICAHEHLVGRVCHLRKNAYPRLRRGLAGEQRVDRDRTLEAFGKPAIERAADSQPPFIRLGIAGKMRLLGLLPRGFGGAHAVFGKVPQRRAHHMVEARGFRLHMRRIAIVVCSAGERLFRQCAGDWRMRGGTSGGEMEGHASILVKRLGDNSVLPGHR